MQDAIATLAYQRFLARGGAHGHDVEDWLAAEAELMRAPHDVVLLEAGPNPIELVRVLREVTGKQLTHVRALVGSVPVIVKRGTFLEADAARQALHAIGAQVELRPVQS